MLPTRKEVADHLSEQADRTQKRSERLPNGLEINETVKHLTDLVVNQGQLIQRMAKDLDSLKDVEKS